MIIVLPEDAVGRNGFCRKAFSKSKDNFLYLFHILVYYLTFDGSFFTNKHFGIRKDIIVERV